MKNLIIIPAYNEQDNIKATILTLNKHNNYDILVVNDGSTDLTSAIVKQLPVELINLPFNLGIGGAMQTGYKFASYNDYDIAVQFDGDGQHNASCIENIVSDIKNNSADLVIGSRFLDKEGFQSTLLRRMGIKYFSKLINLLTRQKVSDPTSGFRACNRKVIDLFADIYPIDFPEPESVVYLVRNGLRVREIPVIMNERLGGKSSIRNIKTVFYMIKVSLALLIDISRKKDKHGVAL